jgi:catechol 2,3-dioxygenase-like lactoylglutathione lyase family enzyme
LDTGTPAPLRLRNVKVPVTDLGASIDWYSKVLGFRVLIEFPDAAGVVRGVHGELPGTGGSLALREDTDAARGLGAFAVANYEVADRSALGAWAAHLDQLGILHDPIVDAPRLSLQLLRNPDGQEVHLYTPIRDYPPIEP